MSGGERRYSALHGVVQDQAKRDEVATAAAIPDQPKRPHYSLAVLPMHIWPSLYAFLPNPPPGVLDTRIVYINGTTSYTCTLDMTLVMQYGLLMLKKLMSEEQIYDGVRKFANYIDDRKTNVQSQCDGGQLVFNWIINGNGLLACSSRRLSETKNCEPRHSWTSQL